MFFLVLILMIWFVFIKDRSKGKTHQTQKQGLPPLPDRRHKRVDLFDPRYHRPEGWFPGVIHWVKNVGGKVGHALGRTFGDRVEFAGLGNNFKLPSFQIPAITFPEFSLKMVAGISFFVFLVWIVYGLFYAGIEKETLFWVSCGLVIAAITWTDKWEETLLFGGKVLGKAMKWFWKKLCSGGRTTPFMLICIFVLAFILARMMYGREYDPQYLEMAKWCIWGGIVSTIWLYFATGIRFVGKKPNK